MLLAYFKGRKVTIPTQDLSRFSKAVNKAPLPCKYEDTNYLRFHGNSDLVEFLGRFDT